MLPRGRIVVMKIEVPGGKPLPEQHELTAAGILAGHFKANVRFIARRTQKTADIIVGNVEWEIKSPTGKGKRNIQHQFYRASKQSRNIVFDARRSKLHMTKISRELERQFKISRNIKRLILIRKDGKIIELSK